MDTKILTFKNVGPTWKARISEFYASSAKPENDNNFINYIKQSLK